MCGLRNPTSLQKCHPNSLTLFWAPATCILWEKPRESSIPGRSFGWWVKWLSPSLSVGLSYPSMFICSHICLLLPIWQLTLRVTPVLRETTESPQHSSACPGHCCPCSTPLMPDLPLSLVGGGRTAGLCPQPTPLTLSCSLLHLPSLLMELTYKSWKPKPP